MKAKEGWVSIKKAAKHYGKSTRTIERWIKAKTLHAKKQVKNGNWLIDLDRSDQIRMENA